MFLEGTNCRFILENLPNIVNNSGFALIQSYLPEESSFVAMSSLGTLLEVQGLAQIQELRPRLQVESSPNLYSGNYGYDSFPLHTDLAHWCIPPRYLVLRCVKGTENVATRLIDGKELIASIGEKKLRRALVQPRRPLNSNRPLLRLYDQQDQDISFLRWDKLFIIPATNTSATIFAEMNNYLDLVQPIEIVLRHLGDTLIVDNWRIMHGRSPISLGSENRQIDRAYTNTLRRSK